MKLATMTSYDPLVMENISSLEAAHASISNYTSFDTLLSDFRDLALRYDQNNIYGLTLVHRHAQVPPGYRLMDFKQTLQPFPLETSANDLHGAPIRPKSLALIAGEWKPYEFELGVYEAPRNDFLAEVQALLQQHQHGQTSLPVGLRRYSPSDPEELEITERQGVSVKIPWDSVRIRCFHNTSWNALTVNRLQTLPKVIK